MIATVSLPFGQLVVQVVCAILIQFGLLTLLVAVMRSLRDGIKQVKQAHTIPCSRCVFFTGDYVLKCTVHPSEALTEQAIHCPDFECPNRRETYV